MDMLPLLLISAFAGMVVGVTIGFFVCAMLFVARRYDRVAGLFKRNDANGRRT